MKKKKILKFLFYLFLIMPFFQIPYFYNNYSFISLMYKGWQLVVGLIMLFLLIIRPKFSKIIKFIVLYLLVLLISTFINDGEIVKCLNSILNILTSCFVIDYEIRDDSKIFLEMMKYYLSLLIFINFIAIILYPHGMYLGTNGYYSNWILGFKNIFILYMLPAILCSYLLDLSKNSNHLFVYILIIICLISSILTKASTGIVGLLVLMFILIINKIINNYNVLNIKIYFLLYITSFFGIVIFRIQNIFSFLIVDILHKDLTFTGRIYIWNYAINFIKKKKLLGYGMENSLKRLYKTPYYQSYHAHNQILEIIYKTGFVGLICFCLIIYKSFKQLRKYKYTKQAFIISSVIFAYLIMSLTEAYDLEYLMFLFVIAFNIECFIKEVK